MKETGSGTGREVPLPTRCQGAGAAEAAAGVALDAGWALEARRYSERRPELNLQRGTREVSRQPEPSPASPPLLSPPFLSNGRPAAPFELAQAAAGCGVLPGAEAMGGGEEPEEELRGFSPGVAGRCLASD